MVLLLFDLISSLSGGVFGQTISAASLVSNGYLVVRIPLLAKEGRPRHQEEAPFRKGAAGVGRSQTMFSECESRTLLVSDHPVCAASVASHHFINGAATP